MLVFVEVRYRARNDYGIALETITRKKRTRIINTAQWFLQSNREFARYQCRFDVVQVSGTPDTPEYEWISNAFEER